MEELIGQTLGQHRIVEQIGEGGMAAVFKAYQSGLARYVAIKVLPPLHAQQPGFSERFVREAQTIAGLHHPNILPVYDFGQERGYSFIVMRYVEGARTLREAMKQPLNLTMAADFIGQVAAALDHAHARKIIHRDVKPANVLMDGDWALLSDFGLVKMTESTAQLTGTGVGVGTPAYMSPEQGQGLPVDHRTDIYSLGVILFEMLTRQIPHNAETPLAIIYKRLHEPLPLPRSLNPAIPEAVERVVLKALAPGPNDRFASAGALAAALRQAVSEATVEAAKAPPTVEASPPETGSTALVMPVHAARPRLPWRWVAGIGGAVAVLALSIGLVTALVGGGRPTAIPAPTPEAAAMAPAATPTVVAAATPLSAPPTHMPTAASPPSPTSVLTATSSPTPLPAATPSPTPVPAATPSSTSRPTATSSPTPPPTRPVEQTRPTATTPPVVYPAPVLIQPEAGANPGSNVTFIWRWDGSLKDNEYFDLRMWRVGEDHRQGVVDCKTTPRLPNQNGEYVVSASISKAGAVDRPGGEWYWSVAVIDMSGGEYNHAPDIGPEAEPRELFYTASGGGGGGGEGGSGGGPPPPPP